MRASPFEARMNLRASDSNHVTHKLSCVLNVGVTRNSTPSEHGELSASSIWSAVYETHKN
jgi:hypothetical protein